MKKLKNVKGITLIALIITIVIMLILAAVTIGSINGGLFEYAGKAKLKTEISSLQEQLKNKQIMTDNKIKDGTISEILKIESPYNDRLIIEDGKLVYISSKWPQKDINTLEEMGIGKSIADTYKENSETIYYIANEETVNLDKFKSLTNMGTLEDFRDMVNAGTFTYEEARLIEDIKLNEGKYELTDEGITFAEDAIQWTSIGTSSKKFNKTFDGQGHIITGLYIDDTNSTTGKNLGLFSQTGSSATIQNLGIKESSIKGYSYIGSFVGTNSGNINNCYSLATLESTYSNIGGISGSNSTTGEINNCYYEGYAFMKTGNTYACLGGIAGSNSGNIISSHNKGNLDIGGLYDLGGISGANSGTIKLCYNEGKVLGTLNWYGGIVGENRGNVEQCYNKGTVEGSRIGGVVGYNASTIKNSYNIGSVIGGTRAGGICCDGSGEIKSCYNIGEITGKNGNVGGIVGQFAGIVDSCYNSGYILGKNYYTGGIAGICSGEIRNCFNIGTVYCAVYRIGGIVGDNRGTVKCCYNLGNIEGNGTYVGGIVGVNSNADYTPTVINCYNVKEVKGKAPVGELIGTNGATSIVQNCYYLSSLTLNPIGTDNGIETDCQAKTESQMKAQDGSFIELLNYGLSENVFIEKPGDFPILSWQAK